MLSVYHDIHHIILLSHININIMIVTQVREITLCINRQCVCSLGRVEFLKIQNRWYGCLEIL